MGDKNPVASKLPRKNFLQIMVAFFAALWSVLTLFPIYRYLRPSKTALAESNVSSVTVGAASDIPVGQGRNFQFGSIPGIITHTSDGQFHAFSAVCTHLGCTVQFRGDIERIWCACHGGQYDPATGEVLAGPPPRPLPPLKVSVQQGQIVVSQA
jgi:cytochrome b6-f complex iron-sulfur subunit